MVSYPLFCSSSSSCRSLFFSQPNSNSPCSSIVNHVGFYVGRFLNRNLSCVQFDSEASLASYIIPIYDSRTLVLQSNKQIMIPSLKILTSVPT